MAKKDRDKLYLTIAVLFIFISLVSLFFSMYSKREVILDKKEIRCFLKIGSKTGLMVTNESLDFGTIIYGSSAQKTIDLANNYAFPIKLELSAEGNISDFLIYDRKIYLDKLEKKTIYISTITFSNESYGNYSGELIILFKKK